MIKNQRFLKLMLNILSISSLYLASLMSFVNIANAETPSPVVMLDSTAQQVVKELKANKGHLADNNHAIVYQIVNQYLIPHVDVYGMSRSVLGRNAWVQATDSQKQAFTKEFTQLVVRTYSSPLAEYTDEVIQFFPVRGGYEGKTFINVNSMIVRSQGNNVPLNYSLVLINNEWKIYDMAVEGVSLLQSFRSQFAQELSQGNMDQLIANLKKHNQQKNT